MGMSVSLHYCCGKLKSIEWASANEKKCGKDHKMGTEKCCDSKSFEHKGNKPHDFAKAIFDQSKSLYHFVYSFVSTFFVPEVPKMAHNYFDGHPPEIKDASLNILYCTYRI